MVVAVEAFGRKPPEFEEATWKILCVTRTSTVWGTAEKWPWSSRKAATSRMAASPIRTVGFKPGSPRARPTNPCNHTMLHQDFRTGCKRGATILC